MTDFEYTITYVNRDGDKGAMTEYTTGSSIANVLTGIYDAADAMRLKVLNVSVFEL